MNNPFRSPSTASFFENLDFGRLRVLGRRGEVALAIIGAVTGAAAGVIVTAMGFVSRALHGLVYGIDLTERLSAARFENSLPLLVGPICGGILLGILLYVLARTRKKPMVDPIEANALHGGRLSLTDSVIVAVQNLVSNGFGASVGLEAGYTQLASGVASKIGHKLNLRRSDLRIVVGCGAAGAIAAAFSAPLTGAFYAFELIIGTYSIVSLTPVVISALTAAMVAAYLSGETATIDVGSFGAVVPADYLPALLLGIICALVGIGIMQMVSLIEETARRSSVPAHVRPAIGGIVVGLLAMVSPQVLSAGHGALHLNLSHEIGVGMLVGLFLLKSLASAVSIGSGFRGGLFFASLFMGALLGKLFAYAAPFFGGATLTPVIYAIIGMSAMAVSVIGGPLTMTFLALESTRDFPITALALAAVITASLVVRTTFGYSFATWRFHLRGESIRSAHDVGWIRNLTVGRMMRADVRTANRRMSLEEFRSTFPLGSTQRVILTDDDGHYAGMVLLADVYASPVERDDQAQPLDRFIRYQDDYLLPGLNAKQAAAIFDRTESDALAVLSTSTERKVVGLLTESHNLRRYCEELDRNRRDLSGEI